MEEGVKRVAEGEVDILNLTELFNNVAKPIFTLVA